VLAVGFVSSGLLTLQQSVGIIIGSNIGTTVTGQIVAFRITEAALPLVALGFALFMLGGRGNLRHLGAVLLGLGLLFHGMGLMSDAMYPLREDEGFIGLMARLDHPLAGILVAAVFTALVQSSSATTGIVITLASQGLISLPAGIALALGANVGTCVTAQLAALGRSLDARRVALVHLLFNLGGALLLVWFIPQYAEVVRSLSPQASGLDGTARLAAEVPRQIANANTIFNALMALLCIGFTAQIAALVKRILPERIRPSVPEPQAVRTSLLLPDYLESPALALDMLRQELSGIGRIAQQLLAAYAPGAAPLPPGAAAALAAHAAQLREQCAAYAGRLSSSELEANHSALLLRLMTAGNDLENICSLLGRRLSSQAAPSSTAALPESDPAATQLAGRLAQMHAAVSVRWKNRTTRRSRLWQS
jgi:phosphate:Na+ symporter